MKKNRVVGLIILIVYFALVAMPIKVNALEGKATVDFSGREDLDLGVRHPETQQIIGHYPEASTKGALRIDFAPELNFGTGTVDQKDGIFPVNAQLYKNKENPTGNFIQISDYRDNPTGWQLQVRQETSFQQKDQSEHQLKGAEISFDKAWVNTADHLVGEPKVTKDIIRMDRVGETYNVAEAHFGEGGGTWSIIFGASKDNLSNQESTLAPSLDDAGQPITDPAFDNQSVFTNQAVQLKVPNIAEQKAGTYTTVLTWIIAELP